MSVSPFIRVIGLPLSQMPKTLLRERAGEEASLVVLPSAEAQWDLKFSDMIRIGVLDLWWYVATVNAIKLRHNICFATRTIHSFIPFLFNFFPMRSNRSAVRRPFSRCVSRLILRSGIGILPLPIRNQPGSVSVPNSRCL